MTVSAPIHDMIIRIKNAYLARRTNVAPVQHSFYKISVLSILKKYGFIESFDVIVDKKNPNKKSIAIAIAAVSDAVHDIPVVRFFSTPSRKRYLGYDQLKVVAGGQGIGVISTPQGLMTVHEAKHRKIGGELLFEIY